MIKPPIVRIQTSTNYRVRRSLPSDADILVQAGRSVHPATPLARGLLTAPPVSIPAASILDVRPKDLAVYLLKRVGDQVKQGDVVARKKATMFASRVDCFSPIDGVVESVSYYSGEITVRRRALPTVVLAESIGKVVEIVTAQAIVIETSAALIQGAFGVGAEVYGQLKVLVDRADGVISAGHLDRSCQGCVVVAGGIDSDGILAQAEILGVRGLIVGTVIAAGHETWLLPGNSLPLSIVVTEGFGSEGIFPPSLAILRRHHGEQVWLRPSFEGKAEIVIPLPDSSGEATSPPTFAIGSSVRIVRAPHNGLFGHIVDISRTARKLESGIHARVAQVQTVDGRRIVVPIANLEVIG